MCILSALIFFVRDLIDMKLALFFPAFVAATGTALTVTAIPAAADTTCNNYRTGSVTAGTSSFSICSIATIGNNQGAGTDNLEYRLNSGDLLLSQNRAVAEEFRKYTWTLATTSLGFQPTYDYENSGTWSLAAGKSINSPFAIAMKGGPDYRVNVYFFNRGSNSSSGTWNALNIVSENGIPLPYRSSLDIYTATAKDVPEPLSILGTGAALGFGVLLKRKYGNKANKERASA